MKRNLKRFIYYFSCLLCFFGAMYILGYVLLYSPINKQYSSFDSLAILNQDRINNGYTLISPYNRMLSDDPNWVSTVYLLDMLGSPVHTWTMNRQVFYSELESDGSLISAMELPKYSKFFPPGGNTGILQRRDWDSNVIWDYNNEAMHHDLAQLPNGNIAVALWEKTPSEIAEQIQGGVEGTEMEGGLIWSDQIVELDRNKQVVWSWHSYEHLNPEIDTLGVLMPRYAWTHTNGLKYMAKNPIDGTESYLVSMRSTSTVMIIRKKDGEIIWRSPKDMLNLQHDPTLLENGNILVFDNGLDRKPDPFPIYGSRVVEINPKANKIVWEFDGGEGAIDKIKFFSAIVGGAQRLENGNTLITDGTRGHIFEVTKEKELVWDFISPYTTQMTGYFPNNFLFKARRYGENEIKWPKPLPAPFNKYKFDIYNILSPIYP